MKKRGISNHLDWIIGFGLFLLFITFIFVMLKPGAKPAHEPDVLLSLVEDNFLNNINWNLERLPIRIDSKSGGINDCGRFPFVNWDNAHSGMYKDDGNPINVFDVNGDLRFRPGVGVVLGFKDYYIVYNEEFNSVNPGKNLPCGIGCKPGITANYGIPETLTGLSCRKISLLSDYGTLKSDWKYPFVREFNLSIQSTGCSIDSIEISPGFDAPLNTPIYVRQITDFVLDDNGERIPVDIIIKVW